MDARPLLQAQAQVAGFFEDILVKNDLLGK